MRKHAHCRMSILVLAMSLSFSGLALAESTHPKEQCGHSPACILTVLKSFVKAIHESGSGVNFSVGP
ncbi:MAG: hypothetical protein HY303_13640 [Candidatus Wallbacteria bacterium]|nr:hypothetical protein [Candidatus Wallbacteria bacterium]